MLNPDAARLHQAGTIQSQEFHCCTPHGCASANSRKRRIPAKMIFPFFAAWIEKRDGLPCH